MTTSPTATSGEQTLHCALELSKNSWLLAVQFPGRDNPSLHPIRGKMCRLRLLQQPRLDSEVRAMSPARLLYPQML